MEESMSVESRAMASCAYGEGSLVWAKVSGYPWWPAMVEPDPDYRAVFDCSIDQPDFLYYHVVFLDKRVTRAWLPMTRVKTYVKFKPDAQEKTLMECYKKALRLAQQTASRAQQLTVQERLEMFSFNVNYKPSAAETRAAAQRAARKRKRREAKKRMEGKKEKKTEMKVKDTEDCKRPESSPDDMIPSSSSQDQTVPEHIDPSELSLSPGLPTITCSEGGGKKRNEKKTKKKKESGNRCEKANNATTYVDEEISVSLGQPSATESKKKRKRSKSEADGKPEPKRRQSKKKSKMGCVDSDLEILQVDDLPETKSEYPIASSKSVENGEWVRSKATSVASSSSQPLTGPGNSGKEVTKKPESQTFNKPNFGKKAGVPVHGNPSFKSSTTKDPGHHGHAKPVFGKAQKPKYAVSDFDSLSAISDLPGPGHGERDDPRKEGRGRPDWKPKGPRNSSLFMSGFPTTSDTATHEEEDRTPEEEAHSPKLKNPRRPATDFDALSSIPNSPGKDVDAGETGPGGERKEDVSRPKKPKFRVAGKSKIDPSLSELAQELKEMMAKTEKLGACLHAMQSPTVRPSSAGKVVPTFSKNAAKP